MLSRDCFEVKNEKKKKNRVVRFALSDEIFFWINVAGCEVIRQSVVFFFSILSKSNYSSDNNCTLVTSIIYVRGPVGYNNNC